MANRRYVSLQVQIKEPKQTLVQNFKAKEWEAFTIVSVEAPTEAEFAKLAAGLEQAFKEMGHDPEKPILILPASMEITLFGIEAEENDSVPEIEK